MSNDRATGSSRAPGFIRNSWRGDERLATAFWGGGLASFCVTLTSFFAALIGGLICLGPVAILFHVSPGLAYEMVAAPIFFCGLGVSVVWWLVSVWRCAPNSGWRPWQFIARGVVVCDAVAAVAFVLLVLGLSPAG